MTVPSSLVVIVPSPSLSNKEKASLNSVGGSKSGWLAPCGAQELPEGGAHLGGGAAPLWTGLLNQQW